MTISYPLIMLGFFHQPFNKDPGISTNQYFMEPVISWKVFQPFLALQMKIPGEQNNVGFIQEQKISPSHPEVERNFRPEGHLERRRALLLRVFTGASDISDGPGVGSFPKSSVFRRVGLDVIFFGRLRHGHPEENSQPFLVVMHALFF